MPIVFFITPGPRQPCYPPIPDPCRECPGPTDPSSYLPFVGGIDVEVTEDSLQAHFVIQLFIGGAIVRGSAGKRERKAKIGLPEGCCLKGSQAHECFKKVFFRDKRPH